MTARIQMFGCQIDRLGMSEAVGRIFEMIANPSSTCQYVVTPNVQHVVMLQKHDGLRRAYENAALVLADGMPLVLSSRLLGQRLPQRVTGADLVFSMLGSAKHYGGVRVYLLGAGPGVAQRAAKKIRERWPAVETVGTYSPPVGFENDADENGSILRRIAAARPDVVVVGLGAPKQEMWVHAHQPKLQASVALCVGATIDFLAENKRRAPHWMQRSGLEWLHRAATEPRRLLRRYIHDAWHFPPLVWREWQRDRTNPSRRQRSAISANNQPASMTRHTHAPEKTGAGFKSPSLFQSRPRTRGKS
jgi:N-acetylglucosaminyldiphosphoundecaprenol N-acetyl-beta-D-mannosaminyltransferase